jgi:hypothetical protein
MEILIETTADKLVKGDIFSFGKNCWDGENRFHSYNFYIDSKKLWVDDYVDGSRICFNYTSFNYSGDISDMGCKSFQWQHIQNPAEIKVYLKQNHLISDTKKYKGQLYYNDHNNVRVYVHYKVNQINMMPSKTVKHGLFHPAQLTDTDCAFGGINKQKT